MEYITIGNIVRTRIYQFYLGILNSGFLLELINGIMDILPLMIAACYHNRSVETFNLGTVGVKFIGSIKAQEHTIGMKKKKS